MIKKLVLSAAAISVFGLTAMAQTAQPAPQPGNDGMRPNRERGDRGPGRGKRGDGKMDGERGMRGGMRGFGFSDADIARLNLSNDQKVRLFDFKKQMAQEREAMINQMKDRQMTDAQREEMRNLMEAKRFGTLTGEQQTKLNQIEAQRKTMMEQRRQKMETARQTFLSIFTLEQRTQLRQFEAERRQKRQEMRQNRRNRMPATETAPNS